MLYFEIYHICIIIQFKMKDRWKITITSLAVAFFLAVVIGCVSASFRRVGIREYGLLFHEIFYYAQNQTARTNGNYLVGIDKNFIKFPRGIISQQFTTMALTKDKSMIQINGFFAGRLIKDEVMGMFENYGFEYSEYLKSSVEELTREAIEFYSLSQIVGDRVSVENNVRGFVCLKLEFIYPWIQCDYVSLGRIGGNIPRPPILPVEVSFEEKYADILQRYIETKRKMNIFTSGGAELLQGLEKKNAQLFKNLTSTILTAVGSSSNKKEALKYYISKPNYPVISSEYQIKI